MSTNGRGPKLLTPEQAKNSLAARMVKTVDRARQVEVRLGFRPYNVFLVWTKWSGVERGEGVELVVRRCPILPTPIVEDLSAVSRSPFSAGTLPIGSIRVRSISATYSQDYLEGKTFPDTGEPVPEPYDFFFEVVEDGRHGREPDRARFRLAATPMLDAGESEWLVLLERQSHDMKRDGQPPTEPVEELGDPWKTRKLRAPEED